MTTLEAQSTRVLSFRGGTIESIPRTFWSIPATGIQGFAEGMAPEAGINGDLTDRQWGVIRFVRRFWEERGSCPTVYQTCRILGLHVAGFRYLFPSGYQRGTCKLAGNSYKAGFPESVYRPSDMAHKSYRIDIWGFLLDPDEWDERFALLKAHEWMHCLPHPRRP